MKEYCILSDIHSQYDLLMNALKTAEFDMENDNHILIIAGDVLDRGYQGDEVIRFIETLVIKKRVLGVLGNHDVFLLDLVDNTFEMKKIIWNCDKNGFKETLLLGWNPSKEFQMEIKTIEKIGRNLNGKYSVFLEWLRELPLFLEFKNHVIVHGFLDFSLDDWHYTSKQFATWERGFNNLVPDEFQKYLIFGHTPNSYINQQHGIIRQNKKIMIDGGASSRIQINILRLTEEEI